MDIKKVRLLTIRQFIKEGITLEHVYHTYTIYHYIYFLISFSCQRIRRILLFHEFKKVLEYPLLIIYLIYKNTVYIYNNFIVIMAV